MTRWNGLVLAMVSFIGCGVPEDPVDENVVALNASDVRPTGKGGERADNHRVAYAARGAAATGNGINYHGGPVMHGAVNAYFIWYGNWSGNSATTILTNFISNEGGSPYYNINTTYTDSTGAVSNAIHYAGAVNDNYSQGKSLSDAAIQAIVSAHAGADLPADTNGIYFVLTSSDVTETSGFCTQYCGWHTNGTIGGRDIKYSFIGNPDRCPSACEFQTTSPNGNAGADGMVSILAHEFEESTSDPDLNAWYDTTGAENADKCAWTFGTTYTVANGSIANMKLGGADYLVQQNWVNANGGLCALSYGSVAPDFSISVSPGSTSVVAGSAANYTVTITASGGFSGGVNLSVSGLPSGSDSATFGTNPATTTSTLTIGTAATDAAGNYTLTITGVSGSLSHTATATLSVTGPTTPDFSLSVSPSSQSARQGSLVRYTVTVTPSNGFANAVNLGVSGLPSGATATFSPNPATTTSTLSIQTISGVRGTFSLRITGTSGTLSHTATASLRLTRH